jgi:peptidoglycan hydrolase-like protein with peptidoglycan-binding domain
VLARLTALAAVATLLVPATAAAAGEAKVAALQVALRARGLYDGPVDGVRGQATERAVRTLQRRKGLTVDGVVGPRTRAALGRLGRPVLGSRVLARGLVGWDVAAVQWLLAWHGFPSARLDGRLGDRTDRALRAFQAWNGLAPDGRAGPATLRALRRPAPTSPLRFTAPVSATATDGFGPRGNRFHTGLDFPTPIGTPVVAGAAGRVTFAGWNLGGYGRLVVVAHGSGVRTLSAHLSRIDVAVGQRVAAGTQLGLVGSTGASTGPHLHWEVRVRGACVDPLSALG